MSAPVQFYIIYRLTNRLNGKSYVGQTRMSFRKRFYCHKCDSRKARYPIERAINKHGWENFQVYILEQEISPTDVDERERAWIKTLNTLVPNGYNVEPGGSRSKVVTPESREKMRLAKLGKKRGPMALSTKRKIGDANKGRKPSQLCIARAREVNAARPNPWLGRHHAEATKLLLSQLNKGTKMHSAEFKERQRNRYTGSGNPFFGRTHSIETRKLLSAHHAGGGKPWSKRQKGT